MPFFSRKSDEPASAEAAPVRSPTSSNKGFFSHRSSANVTPADHDNKSPNRSSTLSKSSTTSKPSIFNRNHEDPSISAARERVAVAEKAEREADRALNQARESVREAKQRAHDLELEAKEEARLAKIKEEQAEQIGKRAKPLGRHG